MRFGFIGSGPVATNLATLARAAGHEAQLSSRTPVTGKVSFTEVVSNVDVVVIAIPFRVCAEMLPALAETLADRIVVDATNPLNEDYSPIDLGTTSAGETIASLLPRARLVKAFNTIFADVMTEKGRDRKGRPATAFIASDDLGARTQVVELARTLGFAPVSAGPLASARYLEALAHLNIRIAFAEGGGSDAAFVYDQAS